MFVSALVSPTDKSAKRSMEGCCSYKEVRQATGVASQCGKCACLAKEVVRETLTKLQTARPRSPIQSEFTAA